MAESLDFNGNLQKDNFHKAIFRLIKTQEEKEQCRLFPISG